MLKNSPSPPKSTLVNPFPVSTSYFALLSKAATLPVSTLRRSPGRQFFSTAVPSISRNTTPVPLNFCKIKPSPPKIPALAFVTKVERVTFGVAHKKADFWAIHCRVPSSSKGIIKIGHFPAACCEKQSKMDK